MKKIYLSIFVLLLVFLPALNVNAESNYKACVGGSLDLSIKCNESDNFEFECTDDAEMSSTYKGYSSVSINGFVSYSKSYALCFGSGGEHSVNVLKNGSNFETITVTVYESHAFDDGAIKKKATCEKDGEVEYVCQNCGNKKTESIKATGHEYEERTNTKPTCTRDGKIIYACKNCTDRKTEVVQATGHEWGNWEIEDEPSCYSNGEKERKCLNCSETESEKIPAYNSHQWGEWKIIEEATCGYTGSKGRYCLRCGEYKSEVIPVNPNNHVLSEWVYYEPTALDDGESYRECSCGQVRESITIPKLKAVIKLNKTSIKLTKNKTYKLKIKKKTNGDYVSYWKSSNKKVVTVDKNGKVKAKKKGKATITVKMESGVKATCKVTVK